VYVAPNGTYSAIYPRVRRRLAAGTIDWVLCGVVFLVASIALGLVQGLGTLALDAGGGWTAPGAALVVLSQLIVLGAMAAYFAWFWTTGSTLGMRALDIELVADSTGEPPSWRRAVPRAVVGCLLALALVNVYFAWSGRTDDEPLNAYERALVAVSIPVAVAGVAAKGWMVLDERRRSALDRLFGLVYVEEFVYSDTRPSPWVDAGR
jgi:uncharacterized RDD family membrane protein YckC